MSFLPISPPCAMGGRFLRSMASAEHWRQEGTNCRSLPLTVTGQELLPLQSRRRWILTVFKSDISQFPCLDDSIGRQLWAGHFVTRSANSISCIFIPFFCGRPGRRRVRQETRRFLTCYRPEGRWLKI